MDQNPRRTFDDQVQNPSNKKTGTENVKIIQKLRTDQEKHEEQIRNTVDAWTKTDQGKGEGTTQGLWYKLIVVFNYLIVLRYRNMEMI